jgi:uncharacterized membrane protein (GlpM family)
MITKEMITRARAQHKKVRYNSALTLMFIIMCALTYIMTMWFITNDMDYIVAFVICALPIPIALQGLKQ